MEYTKKSILILSNKRTIKSLLFTSFLTGILGCTNADKAGFDDPEFEILNSKINKLTEEKTKAEIELSKTAQEKNKLEQASNQALKDLATVNQYLENTTTELDELKIKKEHEKEKNQKLKKEKDDKELQEKKADSKKKKKSLAIAQKKFNECEEKVKKLQEEQNQLTEHLTECNHQLTDNQIELNQTSNSLQECKEELLENSERAKSLQQKLLLVVKGLKSKNLDACIEEENKNIIEIERQLAEYKLKQKGALIRKQETRLIKHTKKLDDLIKIQKSKDEEDSKKFIEPIESDIKSCKTYRKKLTKEKKDFQLKLDKIKGVGKKIENQIWETKEKLKYTEKEIKQADKKKGKLEGKIETLRNNA